MSQIVTKGIVLSRVNYGEADRILTILTPDNGVVSVIAKGVRKSKSKLAGGIELFSESNITFIKGRGEVGTLISTRLVRYYKNIASDINKTMLGYEFLKQIKKVTREHGESEYYELLLTALKSLNNKKISVQLCELWFYARLLWMEGHAPNLATDSSKKTLSPSQAYNFNYESMAFEENEKGVFNASHIKLLRISMAKDPKILIKVIVDNKRLLQTLGLLKSIIQYRK